MKKHAARAARLFFLIQPINALFSGVVVAVAVVFAQAPLLGRSNDGRGGKTSVENIRLGNGGYFAIIASLLAFYIFS